jgi:hypothetical protein
MRPTQKAVPSGSDTVHAWSKYTNHHQRNNRDSLLQDYLETNSTCPNNLISQDTWSRQGCSLKKFSHKSGRDIYLNIEKQEI